MSTPNHPTLTAIAAAILSGLVTGVLAVGALRADIRWLTNEYRAADERIDILTRRTYQLEACRPVPPLDQ